MSIHGHAKVELFDAESKEKLFEVQKDNIVTNALKYLININVANGQNLNDMVFPIASKALGGIILFDNTLTEDPENYNLPTDGSAHIVGFAGQTVSTSSIYRGSFNEAESGRTDHGFKSVWYFGTSQANGTIKALARTHAESGVDPVFYDLLERTIVSRPDNFTQNDTYWYPLLYDDEYLYLWKHNDSDNTFRIAKIRKNMLRMKVADYNELIDTRDIIKTIKEEYMTYSWDDYAYSGSDRHRSATYYATSRWQYVDGYDGYIYAVTSAMRGSNPVCTVLGYFTIKYSDLSFEKSEYKTIVLQSAYRGSSEPYRTTYDQESGDYIYTYRDYLYSYDDFTISNGKLYVVTADRKSIIIADLATPAKQTQVQIFDASSNNYIYQINKYHPRNGGCTFQAYIYTETGYYYRSGLVYADGVYLMTDIQRNVNSSLPSQYGEVVGKGLTLFAYCGERRIYSGWNAGYLGTIANLSKPVDKNASQTMKITYTLTDEDETS